jgi:hypothetical protein
MPGFTNSLWISFSRQVTRFYFTSFHKTRLEFDFGWTAIVAAGAKTATPITAAEQVEAQRFLDDLIRANVFMANNGMAPAPIENAVGATAPKPAGAVCPGFSSSPDADTPASIAAHYAVVERLRQMRIPFGLEGNALSDPCEATATIGAILRFYQPRRAVLFGDSAAILNFYHEGVNDRNLWIVEGLTNIFVPYTKASDLPAHEMQAMPQIKQFASGLNDLTQQILVPEGDRDRPDRPDRD